MTTKAAKLRELLATRKVLACPAAYDALSASLIEKAGFEVAMVSGSALSNALTGQADVGILSYGEFRFAYQYILNATTIPLIVDADTGYGGILPIYRMMQEYQAMGIAGIQIEDQTFPKRCAYFKDTAVVSVDEMGERLKAVLAARADPDFFVIARTDSSKSLGFDEALRRARLYMDIGADMVFISVPPSTADIRRMADLSIPICTTIVEGTVTENLTLEELGDMGIKLVKYPQTLIRASIKTATDVLAELKATGRTNSYRGRLATLEERNTATNVEKYVDFERRLSQGLC